MKFAVAAAGGALGLGAAAGIRTALASPEKASELDQRGISVMHEDAATIRAAALPFAGAAGLTLGLAKRTPTAGFTTAVAAGMGAVLTGSITAFAKADTSDGRDQAIAVGTVGSAVTAGALIGVRDEMKHVARLRMAKLGMFGFAAGMLLPMAVESARDAARQVGASYTHR